MNYSHDELSMTYATIASISPRKTNTRGNHYRHVSLDLGGNQFISSIIPEKIYAIKTVRTLEDDSAVEDTNYAFKPGAYIFLTARYSQEGQPRLDKGEPIIDEKTKKPVLHSSSGFTILETTLHKKPDTGIDMAAVLKAFAGLK